MSRFSEDDNTADLEKVTGLKLLDSRHSPICMHPVLFFSFIDYAASNSGLDVLLAIAGFTKRAVGVRARRTA